MSAVLRSCCFAALALAGAPGATWAQDDVATGLELGALPALAFDSDEGVGYGFVADLYQYGDGTLEPYEWMVRPTVYLTTRGRRKFGLLFDLPHVLPEGWRVNGFLGWSERTTTPYYGVGNSAVRDPTLDDPDGVDPHYYAFGRLKKSAFFNLQRRFTGTSLWALFGAGMINTRADPTPEDEGSTLYAEEFGTEVVDYWTNYLRAGLVWDSRDGVWTEVVVQWVNEQLGADGAFTRWSVTDRRYYAVSDRLVFAHRYFLQSLSGDPPVHQLQLIQTSFGDAEGLGGATTVRGLPRNRFAGRGMLVWNSELRLHVATVRAFGRTFRGGVSAFLDQGRVWAGAVRPSELLEDLHRGYGGGLHLGMGENFTASMDIARSSETDFAAYMGLGYLF